MKPLFAALAAVAVAASITPVSAFDWTGPYVGVNAGFTWAEAESGSVTIEPEGWSLGVVGGYNHVLDGGLVLGLEGSLDWADINASVTDSGISFTSTTDWTAGLRGKLGYDAGEFLPYLTAGIAWSHGTVGFAAPGPLTDEEDAVSTGASVGAGIEVAVSDAVTFKAEYLYTSFGEKTWFDGEIYEFTENSTASTIRAGFNIRF